MNIEQLSEVLEAFWSKETSSSPDLYDGTNRALGQCAVTALVVDDYFGGDILNSIATRPDGSTESHYLNKIDGALVDLTSQQFEEGTTFTEPAPKPKEFDSTREYILSYGPTVERYQMLKRMVDTTLQAIARTENAAR